MNRRERNPLEAERILAELKPDSIVREIIVLNEIDSTNSHLIKLARAGAKPGLVVFAEHQSAGRGRFGRRWESAAGDGLYFSLLVRPQLELRQWTRLTTWAAVAVAEAIEQIVPRCETSIKWPNDVLLKGRKVSGILAETCIAQPAAAFAVVGVGINVNQQVFPPALADKAISLRQFTGHDVDRAVLVSAVIDALARTELTMISQFHELLQKAATRSCVLGRPIKTELDGRLIEGTAERLTEDGSLQMRTGTGHSIRLSAGEVSLVAAGIQS